MGKCLQLPTSTLSLNRPLHKHEQNPPRLLSSWKSPILKSRYNLWISSESSLSHQTQVPVWGSFPDDSQDEQIFIQLGKKTKVHSIYILNNSNLSVSGWWDGKQVWNLCGSISKQLSKWKIRGHFKSQVWWLKWQEEAETQWSSFTSV